MNESPMRYKRIAFVAIAVSVVVSVTLFMGLAMWTGLFVNSEKPEEKLEITSFSWSDNLEGATLYLKNTGETAFKIHQLTINNTVLDSEEWTCYPSVKLYPEDEALVAVSPLTLTFEEEMVYIFSLTTESGSTFKRTLVTPTAPQTSQAGAILVKENVRYYSVDTTQNRTEFTFRNTGSADAKIVAIYWSKTSFSATSKLVVTEYTMIPATGVVSVESTIVITIRWGVSGGTIADTEWLSGTTYYYKFVTEAGQSYEYAERAP
jgi:hypothetical protein